MSRSNPFDRVGVVGAGFMGSGIGETLARAGLDVVLYEPEQGPLDRSRARVEQSLEKAVERARLSAEHAGDALERLRWTRDLDALAGCDLAIEAVVEDAAVKEDVFARLDARLAAEAVLATNTSSISIARLAACTRRPERVLGLHFFSPVPAMALVELVASVATAEEVVARCEAFAAAIGKTPIRAGDRAGFVVNALLVPYLMSAIRMYESGFVSREDLDAGMRLGAGHPMGPLTLADLIGLDVLHAIGETLFEEFKRPEYASPPLLARLVQSGHHGRKSGRGFYVYEPVPAPAAVAA